MRAIVIAISWALLGWTSAGCAGAPSTASKLAPDHEEAESGLVWITDATGRHRTLWVSTSDGRPLSSFPLEGPVWAQGSMLWQWTQEPRAVSLQGCDAAGRTSERPDSAIAYRVVLRELTQSLAIEMRGVPQVEPVSALSHAVEPIASVGPFLFAREELAYVPCGAPRNAEARALVWDLARGGPAEILSEPERRRIAHREASAARADLRAQGVEDLDEIQLAALAPRWAPTGLSVDYLFVTERCDGCIAGWWGAYASAARVTASLLPAQLAERARVPDWVRRAVAAIEGAQLAGFSRIEHPAPLRVLDALRR